MRQEVEEMVKYHRLEAGEEREDRGEEKGVVT